MSKVLDVKDLEVSVKIDNERRNIVNKVSFSVNEGETLGIVGESGCGKSMTSLSIMDLLPQALSVTGGSLTLNGEELTKLSKNAYRKKRGKEMAMIFQEPMTSLNPVYTIGFQIVELVRNHTKKSKKEAYDRALHMLKLVGIPRADQVLHEYPHQLSGGMRQRVMIAMALSCNPGLLIADEPTTALDVTIQAQILRLMQSLQDEMNMSIVMITHDLGVVAETCDRVIVMYAGEVVEEATVEELFESPKHPYTKGLVASVPNMDKDEEYLSSISGTVPTPEQMPTGCRFAPRCKHAFEACHQTPPLFDVNEQSKSRCWLYHEEASNVQEGRKEVGAGNHS
ncbi:ABC transporter ATP-binding protein [Halobacillus aidingensis]|uniref:Peptide/nickel transport system ATP-binding protein n=1 Tax=Halobacillus aidingensis TaxID=240303 RepID=A0A1H0H0H5_HALAD|nr:ABC transporter ATP-binding protein [Halobacillus aidingensis]SDO12677.1 peptide/nickel transport system ATP-binding protein [Halobacillus aidingensis]